MLLKRKTSRQSTGDFRPESPEITETTESPERTEITEVSEKD